MDSVQKFGGSLTNQGRACGSGTFEGSAIKSSFCGCGQHALPWEAVAQRGDLGSVAFFSSAKPLFVRDFHHAHDESMTTEYA